MPPAKGVKQIKEHEPGPMQLTQFFEDQKRRGVVKAACPTAKDLYAQSTYNTWWVQKKGKRARETFNRWYTICINHVYGPDEGAAAFAAGHVPIPSTPASSAAMGPSPPPPKSKEKKLQVTVDKDETTWDQFFIAPEIVKIDNRSIAPLIVVLSSTISSSNDITVFVTKDVAKLTFKVPDALLKRPKKGDAVTYLFFDLPFDCSPRLATDLLDGRYHGDIPVVKTYVGTPGGEKDG
ncbi:predicted protein [Chaetoceros tenuissimus]|uniref:Uncharacterized protein n=1 Tax=Chaetoceros tenuissimus TaxID=426638 RepID=A0AAD3H575_9STRA|nr:predicted protein [Chaetoceros tenuissimus]